MKGKYWNFPWLKQQKYFNTHSVKIMEGISMSVVCTCDIDTTKYANTDIKELHNHTTTIHRVENTFLRTHTSSNHSGNLQ